MPDTNSPKEKNPVPVQERPRIVPCLDPYEDCGINGTEMFERHSNRCRSTYGKRYWKAPWKIIWNGGKKGIKGNS